MNKDKISYRVKRILRIAVGLPFAIGFLFLSSPFYLLTRAVYGTGVIVDAVLAAFNKQTFATVKTRNFYRSIGWWQKRNIMWLATANSNTGGPLLFPRVDSNADR